MFGWLRRTARDQLDPGQEQEGGGVPAPRQHVVANQPGGGGAFTDILHSLQRRTQGQGTASPGPGLPIPTSNQALGRLGAQPPGPMPDEPGMTEEAGEATQSDMAPQEEEKEPNGWANFWMNRLG